MFYNELDKSDYFDLIVSKDCRDFYRDYSECDLINIDITNNLCSIKNAYSGDDIYLKNISLTGYDNTFIPNDNTIFNGINNPVSTKTKNGNEILVDPTLTYVIESGDTFCFHSVSGYTGLYGYDINTNEIYNNEYYNQLNGGFYQGFYKVENQPVEWFPSRVRLGWTSNMVIHFPMYTNITGATKNILNDDYSGNTGFIFYMGTRAENKFTDLTDIEIQKLNDGYGIAPKEGANIYTYSDLITLDGINKYIGYYNYHDGSMYTGKKYTEESKKLKYKQEYVDLYYNSIGVRITPDGRIGYRTIYPTDICYTGETQEVSGVTNESFVLQPDNPCKNHTTSLIVTKYFTIEECYTKKPMIDVNEEKFMHISCVFERDFPYNDACELKYGEYKKGNFSIYINGFLVLRNTDFIELITHGLDTEDVYQEGVPYNLSYGGGTQNLNEALYLDNTKQIDTILDKFFTGTFLGGVKDFQMLCTPLYTMEIKDIIKNITTKYNLKTIKGGRKIFINKLF